MNSMSGYWFHSLQSIRHYLVVDLISALAFQRSHSPAVIYLKIWLSLPQNATQTLLFSVTLLDSTVQTFQLQRPDRRSHILPRSPLTSPNHTILDQKYIFIVIITVAVPRVCVCLFVVFCHCVHLYSEIYVRMCSPRHGKLYIIGIIIVIFC